MHRKEGALRAQSSARNYRRPLIREEELGSLGSSESRLEDGQRA